MGQFARLYMVEQSFIEQVSYLSAEEESESLFPQLLFLKAF